jgi:hypothetical protein
MPEDKGKWDKIEQDWNADLPTGTNIGDNAPLSEVPTETERFDVLQKGKEAGICIPAFYWIKKKIWRF